MSTTQIRYFSSTSAARKLGIPQSSFERIINESGIMPDGILEMGSLRPASAIFSEGQMKDISIVIAKRGHWALQGTTDPLKNALAGGL